MQERLLVEQPNSDKVVDSPNEYKAPLINYSEAMSNSLSVEQMSNALNLDNES